MKVRTFEVNVHAGTMSGGDATDAIVTASVGLELNHTGPLLTFHFDEVEELDKLITALAVARTGFAATDAVAPEKPRLSPTIMGVG